MWKITNNWFSDEGFIVLLDDKFQYDNSDAIAMMFDNVATLWHGDRFNETVEYPPFDWNLGKPKHKALMIDNVLFREYINDVVRIEILNEYEIDGEVYHV